MYPAILLVRSGGAAILFIELPVAGLWWCENGLAAREGGLVDLEAGV